MAEDQERILLDQIIKLEETVARLMDQGEKDGQALAHMADAVNKLAVRVTRLEVDSDKLTTIADYLSKIADSHERRVVNLEGKGNDHGNETGNGTTGQAGEASHVPNGEGAVRNGGGDGEGAGGGWDPVDAGLSP